GVGKSAIAARINNLGFDEYSKPTIGASFSQITVLVDNQSVSLCVWDTAGQERFRAITPLYYRNARVAFVVYDVTDDRSFVDAKSWVEELRTSTYDALLIYLIGNKVDLSHQRKISAEVAREYAESIGASFWETSALANSGRTELVAAQDRLCS
ncbi:unnamed protein product, partial [Soboliphyme baturini]|uniref:Ras-related protein Rab-5B n=1 Tax=Soboliphyme baturini TaxID=241478 RepID=A0A183IJU5_9BILA